MCRELSSPKHPVTMFPEVLQCNAGHLHQVQYMCPSGTHHYGQENEGVTAAMRVSPPQFVGAATQAVNKPCFEVNKAPPEALHLDANVALVKEFPSKALRCTHSATCKAAHTCSSGGSLDGTDKGVTATEVAAEMDAGRGTQSTHVKTEDGKAKEEDGLADYVASTVKIWPRDEAEDATDLAKQGTAVVTVAAPIEEQESFQSEPTEAAAEASRNASERSGNVASTESGEEGLPGEEEGGWVGANAPDTTEIITSLQRDATSVSGEDVQNVVAATATDVSAETEKESTSGILQDGTEALEGETPAADGRENGVTPATRRKLVAAYGTGASRVQERIPAGEPPQAAQQFHTPGHKEVTRSFFLPLKRMVYTYLCELRMLLRCRLEKLSQVCPSVRLLEEEQEKLQLIPSTETGLLRPARALTSPPDGRSPGPTSTGVSPASADHPTHLNEDSAFPPSGKAFVASVGGGRFTGEGCSVCAAARWKPFTLHISNTLEADNITELLPYLEIFEPCLHAAVSPADLAPQACALLCTALRHVENSGFSVNGYKQQSKHEEDRAFSAVTIDKPAKVRCSSATLYAPAAVTTPVSAAPTTPAVARDEGRMHRCDTTRAINQDGRLHSFSGERQLAPAEEGGTIHACDMCKTGGETISTADRESLPLRSCDGDVLSSRTCDFSAALSSASSQVKRCSQTSLGGDPCVAASNPEEKYCKAAGTRGIGESEQHPRVKTTATATSHDPATTRNCTASYRDSMNRMLDFFTAGPSRRACEEGNTEMCARKAAWDWTTATFQTGRQNPERSCGNALKEENGGSRMHRDKRPAGRLLTGEDYQAEGRRNGGVRSPSNSGFFRFEGNDDPLLAKALGRAKLVCLEHLHWLRQLVPSWSGEAYHDHTEAVLRACNVPELANYLIVFSILQPDVANQLPVTAASLRECLEELHILHSGFACSAIPSDLPHGYATAKTSNALLSGSYICSTRKIDVPAFASMPHCPSTSTVRSTDPTVTTSTSAVLLHSQSTASCIGARRCGCTSHVPARDSVSLPLSKRELANGLLSYYEGQHRVAVSGSSCRDAAGAAASLQQSGAAVPCCSRTLKVNSRYDVAASTTSQSFKPLPPADHTYHVNADAGSWRLYGEEIEASLQRVFLEGDSWLLQPSHANRPSAAAGRNCWDITCNAEINQHWVEAERHDNISTLRRRRNDNRKPGETANLRRQYGNPRICEEGYSGRSDGEKGSFREQQNCLMVEDSSAGDDANPENFKGKSSREVRDENSLGCRSSSRSSLSSIDRSVSMNAPRLFTHEAPQGNGESSVMALRSAIGAAARVPAKLPLPSHVPLSSPSQEGVLTNDSIKLGRTSLVGGGYRVEYPEKGAGSSSIAVQTHAKIAIPQAGMVMEAADSLLAPLSRRTEEQIEAYTDGIADEQQNDYVSELLLLLDESRLPCHLQEQLYAEVLQYVSSPVVSLAQWKQVVWHEAQQLQQEQQGLQHHEGRRTQGEQLPQEQQRRSPTQRGERSGAWKQRTRQTRLRGTLLAERNNETSCRLTKKDFKRRKRGSRKRRPLTSRSSRAGRK